MELNRIYNEDCLEGSERIASGSVDLILTDLPYGNMKGLEKTEGINHGMQGKTKWDVVIEPKTIHEIANRTLRKNGKMALFSQEPYTTKLITNQNANVPFSYRMVWEKDHFANSLIAKKAPVSYYEDILLFSKIHDNEDLHPLRNYLKNCKKKSGMTNKEFNHLFSDFYNKKGDRNRSVLEHYWAASQFCLPTEEIYKKILQPTGFFQTSYEELKQIDNEFKTAFPSTFNLWQGKKYKSNILKYKKDYTGYHPTQKPILLLEDLIKTFSNEGDTVVDLTIGSGSTAIACMNTNRNYIGFELDEDYYNIATKRIAEHIN